MSRFVLALLALSAASGARAAGGSVVGSKHDLSVTGPGEVRALSEESPCIFCHVAHGGGEVLSSRPATNPPYTPYTSTTSSPGGPGQPTGASRVCLSCHDGTIAVGETRQGRIQTTIATLAGRSSDLGTDLRKTHPVSFRPPAGGKTHPPADAAVKLDATGQLQCTACHDPHLELAGAPEGKFLVKTTQRGTLCLACHDSASVGATGSHAISPATFGVAQGNDLNYASVGVAACAGCHRPHAADAGGRLLKKQTPDDDAICMRCHSSITRKNIGADLSKPFAHQKGPGVHDAAEGRPGATKTLPESSPATARHAACVDCHEPHVATTRAAPGGGAVGGVLDGVWGIDLSGQRVVPAVFEYQVCFKCHADSQNRPPPAIARDRPDSNLRNQLSGSAISFHPITGPGRSSDVPSLRPGWSTASVVYCTDCHASNTGPGAGGSGARGPHGSIYPHLLERDYQTGQTTIYSASAYALCFKCHDPALLLSPPNGLHDRHVRADSTPCSACHASHGVAASSGTAANNQHLIDFDVSYVLPSGGARRWVSRGARSGGCTLSCHTHTHAEATSIY